MTDHKLNVNDGAKTEDAAGADPATETVKRKVYIVTDQTRRDDVLDDNGDIESHGSEGIYKNGQLYKPGDEIELDENTAANFLANGDITEGHNEK